MMSTVALKFTQSYQQSTLGPQGITLSVFLGHLMNSFQYDARQPQHDPNMVSQRLLEETADITCLCYWCVYLAACNTCQACLLLVSAN